MRLKKETNMNVASQQCANIWWLFFYWTFFQIEISYETVTTSIRSVARIFYIVNGQTLSTDSRSKSGFVGLSLTNNQFNMSSSPLLHFFQQQYSNLDAAEAVRLHSQVQHYIHLKCIHPHSHSFSIYWAIMVLFKLGTTPSPVLVPHHLLLLW